MKTWWSNNWKRLAEIDSGVGLSFFRIHCAIAIFMEVIQLWLCRRLIFTTSPLGDWSGMDPTLILLLWMAALVALGLGWQTRIMSVLNWALAMWWSADTRNFEYHNDYFMWGVSTLLLFIPAALPFSLDGRAGKATVLPATRAVAYRLVLIFFGVGLVYFDSLFWKYGDAMWLRGLGLWYPATLPHVGWSHLDFLLGNEWLVRSAGYITLVFESVFLFLLPFRFARWPLIITGVTLHAGIFVAFPIPAFGFSVIAVYWLLVPDVCYQRWLKAAVPVQTQGFSGARRWTMIAMVIGLMAQLMFSLNGPPLVHETAVACLGKKPVRTVEKLIWPIQRAIRPWSVRTAGIITHCVFTYPLQFEGYNHPLTLREAGTDHWLPIVTPEGKVHPWCHGRIFVHCMWRINSPIPEFTKLESGYARFAEWDCLERGLDPAKTHYEVMYHPFPLEPVWTPTAQVPKVGKETWQPVFDLIWDGHRFVMKAKPGTPTIPKLVLP